ncbi:MAG TPA: DEAD/DEAH box helicase [Chloroflexota bacterium]|nr:DEAD/DEAH box helicase [Chloroflexota bacterium]
MEVRLALKARLPRTWPAFFERHGNFTAAQLAAMPALLDGHNVVISAPTASGKTEAAMAPLVERHCCHGGRGLAILYVVPTRALVADVAARLGHALEQLGVSLAVKTRDLNTFRPSRPPAVLITTPESADALLASRPETFANLRAAVVDELHLLDGTPRGDQMRVILNRIRRIRDYARRQGDAPDAEVQYAALSATLPAPAAAAARYFPAARLIQIPGERALESEQMPLAADGTDQLIAYLLTFRARGWQKALVFCNSRAEVEAYAAAIRPRSPFGSAVFVHYSNIDAGRRREIEQEFAGVSTAVLFATSTLELGIDIGNVDVVILVGPPGNRQSFIQRIGRGNRRRDVTRVACFYRTPLERLLFSALLGPAGHNSPMGTAPGAPSPADDDSPAGAASSTSSRDDDSGRGEAPFRLSVAVQQIFSLIKGSPVAAVRLAELCDLFEGMVSPADLESILNHLQRWDYLSAWRPGEWRAGTRLNELFDQQTRAHCPLSIYSNIQGETGREVEVRDRDTHQTVARVAAWWLDQPLLTLQGRPVSVAWYDGEAMWVTRAPHDLPRRLEYRSERQLLSHDLARLLPEQLGLPPGTAPIIPEQRRPDEPEAGWPGWWLFHWLGDLYGRALLGLLRYRLPATETEQPGLCLLLPEEPPALPSWTAEQVTQYLEDNYRRFEPLLTLGPFHGLLPVHLRCRAVIEQFDVPRFLQAVHALRPRVTPDSLADDLVCLLPDL